MTTQPEYYDGLQDETLAALEVMVSRKHDADAASSAYRLGTHDPSIGDDELRTLRRVRTETAIAHLVARDAYDALVELQRVVRHLVAS